MLLNYNVRLQYVQHYCQHHDTLLILSRAFQALQIVCLRRYNIKNHTLPFPGKLHELTN